MADPRLRRRLRLAAICGFWIASGVAAVCAEPAAFDCLMDPSLTLRLGSPTQSILESVAVERGDRVRKGQVVATLESRVEAAAVSLNAARAESDAEIQAKKAVLDEKRAVLERKTQLSKRGVGSVQDADTAMAEFRVAEQEVALSELNRRLAQLELGRSQAMLAERTIRSPIEGVVVQRSLGPGEYVRQDAYIVSVAQLDPLNVEVFLPVRYYGVVRLGEIATVRPSQPEGAAFKAEVTVIDQLSDAASGTFGVRLKLPNPGDKIPAGFRCKVEFPFPVRLETAADAQGGASN